MYGLLIRWLFSCAMVSAVVAGAQENSAKVPKESGSVPTRYGDWGPRVSSHDRWNQRPGGETPRSWRGGNGWDRQRSVHDRESPPRDEFSHRNSGPRTDFVQWSQPPVNSGYVFIDGEYLSPPYTVRIDETRLLVNDRQVALPQRTDNDYANQFENPALPWSHRMARELRMGTVILASGDTDNSMVILFLPRFDEGYQFLSHIHGTTLSELESTEVSPYQKQFDGYVPSQELQARLELDLANIESARKLTHGQSLAAQPMGSWAYPLTAVAMLLVAIASGQLFVSRSLLVKNANKEAPDISQAMERCLLFIVGLSVLDLTCTLLALQAGVMHELNPLAGQFLSNPLALTTFKIGITLCGAALLYALRSHFPARRAAWWLCLVCVLVALRWVAFNSLFIA